MISCPIILYFEYLTISDTTLLWLSNRIGLMVEASKIVVDNTLSRHYASTIFIHNSIVSKMKNALRITSTIKLYSASCKRTC